MNLLLMKLIPVLMLVLLIVELMNLKLPYQDLDVVGSVMMVVVVAPKLYLNHLLYPVVIVNLNEPDDLTN
ncbi:unnamed protein product [[Candida] boidinii]|uniref:Unnamed protein product n=1 Tax=Candida boidinii TaxID=5477 RepID=A0ACB5UAK6_CANBO|nr:unnamed protein product [[Candida] boidinii]